MLVMSVLVAALFLLFYWSWTAAQNESLQRRLWPLAEVVATAFSPHILPVIDEGALLNESRRFLLPNPSVDIYLLDAKGQILNSFCNTICQSYGKTIPPEILLTRLDPKSRTSFPLYGPDPSQEKRQAVYAIAPVPYPGPERFYVYLVLSNALGENRSNKQLMPVAWNATLLAGISITVFLMVLGQYLINRTFAPFAKIMETVNRLQQKDYAARAPDGFLGELGELSGAINGMGAKIAEHVLELKDKDKRRMELISNVWHDIRAPLTGVNTLAQLLERQKGSDSNDLSEDTVLKSLLANTTLLGRILSDLQELGQLELGDIQPKMQRTSVGGLIDEISLVYGPRADEKQIRLEFEVPEGLLFILADQGMIIRVLSNLLENALRYTPQNGYIALRVFREDERLLLIVEDNGVGILPEHLPRIFERKFQAVDPGVGEPGLSGLGLAIVKMIVERHAGTILVESIPGQLTRFQIRLPLFEEPVSAEN